MRSDDVVRWATGAAGRSALSGGLRRPEPALAGVKLRLAHRARGHVASGGRERRACAA
jgi:hypothetical protein